MAPVAFRPVSDGAGIVHSIFPGATITSSYRPSGTRLKDGQTHDKSWHTQSHAAVDIAPIPGMTFEQAKARIEAQGHPLIEARDEVNNPSQWSTGPHWHFVIGAR